MLGQVVEDQEFKAKLFGFHSVMSDGTEIHYIGYAVSSGQDIIEISCGSTFGYVLTCQLENTGSSPEPFGSERGLSLKWIDFLNVNYL